MIVKTRSTNNVRRIDTSETARASTDSTDFQRNSLSMTSRSHQFVLRSSQTNSPLVEQFNSLDEYKWSESYSWGFDFLSRHYNCIVLYQSWKCTRYFMNSRWRDLMRDEVKSSVTADFISFFFSLHLFRVLPDIFAGFSEPFPTLRSYLTVFVPAGPSRVLLAATTGSHFHEGQGKLLKARSIIQSDKVH